MDKFLTAALRDCLNERLRQYTEEPNSLEQDLRYPSGTLARAAAGYLDASVYELNDGNIHRAAQMPDDWPFEEQYWKPDRARRNLVRAAALILAQIEVLDRLEDAVNGHANLIDVGDAMKYQILKWFGTGQVGASSQAMALAAAGVPQEDHSHPYDPSDFNRCLLLQEAAPEIRQHMGKVASMSAVWARLVERWDEVEQCFIEEAGLNWSKASRAPKTYAMLKEIRYA